VAQRNQFAGAFGGHDASQLRHGQRITLADPALLEGVDGRCGQANEGFRHGFASGWGFLGHVHHLRRTVPEVRQFRHGSSLFEDVNGKHSESTDNTSSFFLRHLDSQAGFPPSYTVFLELKITV
jgi:hypothetical protein